MRRDCVVAAFALSASVATSVSQGQTPFVGRQHRALDSLTHSLLLIRSSANVGTIIDQAFHQEPSFYYYTGLENTLEGVLVLDGVGHESWLFLPDSLTDQLKFLALAHNTPADTALMRARVDHVARWSELAPLIDRRKVEDASLGLLVSHGGTTGDWFGDVGTPIDSIPLDNPYLLWKQAVERRWPSVSVRADSVTPALRRIKDETEIATLRTVSAMSVKAWLAGLATIAPGHRQSTATSAIVRGCLAAGGVGTAAYPWVRGGIEATAPALGGTLAAYRHGDRAFEAGELVHLDVGCETDHYMSDIGRTVPSGGRFDAGQRETWDFLVQVYRAGLAAIHDGALVNDVYAASFGEVKRLQPRLRTPLAQHAARKILTPHGPDYWEIRTEGLEVDEEAVAVLHTGMVITYEPTFSVDGQGFYLQDMLLVTRNGAEILDRGMPYTAAEIEARKANPR